MTSKFPNDGGDERDRTVGLLSAIFGVKRRRTSSCNQQSFPRRAKRQRFRSVVPGTIRTAKKIVWSQRVTRRGTRAPDWREGLWVVSRASASTRRSVGGSLQGIGPSSHGGGAIRAWR